MVLGGKLRTQVKGRKATLVVGLVFEQCLKQLYYENLVNHRVLIKMRRNKKSRAGVID